jgi:streptogramin lyase
VTGAKVRVALVADDHYASTAGYALRVWTNGACRYFGSPGLPHGAPLGGPFGNWVVKEYPVTPGGTTYTVSIANAGGDWYALDWVELELVGG